VWNQKEKIVEKISDDGGKRSLPCFLDGKWCRWIKFEVQREMSESKIIFITCHGNPN
jgi:hypothetical protein